MSKNDETTLINFKCDTELADEFKRLVKEQGYSQSLVLRELMKDYISKNDKLELPITERL